MDTSSINGDLETLGAAVVGGRLTVSGITELKSRLEVKGFLDAPNLKTPCKGLYADVDRLREKYPEPLNGWWAITGDVDSVTEEGTAVTGNFYIWVGDQGVWKGKMSAEQIQIVIESDSLVENVSKLQEMVNENAAKIEQEKQDRAEADDTLQGNIDAEEEARKSADDDLDSRKQDNLENYAEDNSGLNGQIFVSGSRNTPSTENNVNTMIAQNAVKSVSEGVSEGQGRLVTFGNSAGLDNGVYSIDGYGRDMVMTATENDGSLHLQSPNGVITVAREIDLIAPKTTLNKGTDEEAEHEGNVFVYTNNSAADEGFTLNGHKVLTVQDIENDLLASGRTTDGGASISAEKQALSAAQGKTLQGNIDSEKADRQEADEALKKEVEEYTDNSVAGEKADREAQDTSLWTQVNKHANSIADLQDNLEEEITDRQEADESLKEKLSSLSDTVDTKQDKLSYYSEENGFATIENSDMPGGVRLEYNAGTGTLAVVDKSSGNNVLYADGGEIILYCGDHTSTVYLTDGKVMVTHTGGFTSNGNNVLTEADVVDDYETSSSTKPLSARIGKVLYDLIQDLDLGGDGSGSVSSILEGSTDMVVAIAVSVMTCDYTGLYEYLSYGVDVDFGEGTREQAGNASMLSSLPVQSAMKGVLLHDMESLSCEKDMGTGWTDSTSGTTPYMGGTPDISSGKQHNVMVKVPGHYFKAEKSGSKLSVRFSEYALPGFTYIPTYYVGSYLATIYRDQMKLESLRGVDGSGGKVVAYCLGGDLTLDKGYTSNGATVQHSPMGAPAVNMTRAKAREYARAKHTGDGTVTDDTDTKWGIMPWWVWKDLVWLFVTEEGSMNLQTRDPAYSEAVAGEFRNSTDGYWQGLTGLNETWTRSYSYWGDVGFPSMCGGWTDQLGDGSGHVAVKHKDSLLYFCDRSDSNTYYNSYSAFSVMRWRGIENLWGGVWQMLDGVYINAETGHVLTCRNHTASAGTTDEIEPGSSAAEEEKCGYTVESTYPSSQESLTGYITAVDGTDGSVMPTLVAEETPSVVDRKTEGLTGDFATLTDLYDPYCTGDPELVSYPVVGGGMYSDLQGGLFAMKNMHVNESSDDVGCRLVYLPDDEGSDGAALPVEELIAQVWQNRDDIASLQTAVETAQSTADTAVTNAATAQTTAESAQTAAEKAQSTADTAVTNAATAQTAAETAQQTAENAQGTADTAVSNAATAQQTAENAQTTADEAKEIAESATTALDSKQDKLTEGDGISIEGNVISCTATNTEVTVYEVVTSDDVDQWSVWND